MDQRKKLIVGGAVAVAVTVFVVVVLFFSLGSKPKEGILSEEEPKFDIKDLKNIATGDAHVLVAFQGYAKYLSADYGKKVYLALAPVTGVNAIAIENRTLPQIVMRSEHGILDIDFLEENKKVHIQEISLSTDDGDSNKSCHVKDAAFVYDEKSHFECEKPLVYSCVMTMKDTDGKETDMKVAELHISAIRTELNGNAADHKAGKFTNPAAVCP